MIYQLLDVFVVEAIALWYTFSNGWLDGRVEVIIMLSQLPIKLKLKLKLSLAIFIRSLRGALKTKNVTKLFSFVCENQVLNQ